LDWILDHDTNELASEDVVKKTRLNDMMKKKLLKRDFDEDELNFLGMSSSSMKLSHDELCWLIDSDGTEFTEDQKKQKKKLVDMMKRKLKTRDLSMDDLKLLRGVKSHIGLDSDELDWILNASDDKLTEQESKKKKKLKDIMTTKLKKRDFNDDELKMLQASSSLLSQIEEEELLWLMDSSESTLSPENVTRRRTLLNVLKNKLITKPVEEDQSDASNKKKSSKPSRKRRGGFKGEIDFDLDNLTDQDKNQIILEISGIGLQDIRLEDLLFAIRDSDGNLMEGFSDLDWIKNLKVKLNPVIPPLNKFYKDIPGKIYKSDNVMKIQDVKGEIIPLDDENPLKPYHLYTPDNLGLHQLKRGDKPEYFHVHDNPPISSKSTVTGPSQCNLFEKTVFEVTLFDSKGSPITSGNDEVEAIISLGKEKKRANVRDLNNGKYLIEHTFSTIGDHTVEAKVMGIPVSNSPLTITVIKDKSPYVVSRYVDIKLTHDNLSFISSRKMCFSKIVLENNIHRIYFEPMEDGEHMISIMNFGQNVTGSPFLLKI
jgi:hypothetical protein